MDFKGFKKIVLALSVIALTLISEAPAFSAILDRNPIPVSTPDDVNLVAEQFDVLRSKMRENISDERHLPLMRHHGVQTEYVVLLIHGLYGSPHHMKYIQDQFYIRGMNTVSWLLPGHFPKNYTDMDKVTYQEWMTSSREALKWAQRLGKKVILAGFSTGALIETIFASEPENKIAGLFMVAPALKIHAASFLAAHIGDALGLIGNDFAFGKPNGKNISYYSPHAAVELEAMSIKFRNKFPNYKHLKLPIMVVSFNNDFTVDAGEIDKLITQSRGISSALRIPLGSRSDLWQFSTFEPPVEFDMTPNKILNHGIVPGMAWNAVWNDVKKREKISVANATENWLGDVRRYAERF